MNENKCIIVGITGGIAVYKICYLVSSLKKQGYDVTCCFMRNWDSFANNDIAGNPTIKDDTHQMYIIFL